METHAKHFLGITSPSRAAIDCNKSKISTIYCSQQSWTRKWLIRSAGSENLFHLIFNLIFLITTVDDRMNLKIAQKCVSYVTYLDQA